MDIKKSLKEFFKKKIVGTVDKYKWTNSENISSDTLKSDGNIGILSTSGLSDWVFDVRDIPFFKYGVFEDGNAKGWNMEKMESKPPILITEEIKDILLKKLICVIWNDMSIDNIDEDKIIPMKAKTHIELSKLNNIVVPIYHKITDYVFYDNKPIDILKY